jgi:ribosomal protein S18 acetylase RimI-like enzyme
MADIRRFQPPDRAAVREICRATAYGGAEPLLDPRLFTELMTRYYTDFTPEAVWVAERRGRLVGYLAGCFDEAHLRRAMAWRIIPAAVAGALARGLLLRPALWRLLAGLPRFAAAARRGGEADLAAYPAHLHVNLLPEARGRGVGEQLVAQLCAEAARRGLPGVHATVLEENRAARRFFERLGFRALLRQPAFRPPSRRGRLDEKIVYGKEL